MLIPREDVKWDLKVVAGVGKEGIQITNNPDTKNININNNNNNANQNNEGEGYITLNGHIPNYEYAFSFSFLIFTFFSLIDYYLKLVK